jgi:predicted  nucleic acid-binding Zn-ribbon protein
MPDENIPIERVCHNCGTKYTSVKRGCPSCGSVRIRPKWVIDKRNVSKNFEVLVNKKFSPDGEQEVGKIIQLHKSWYNDEEGRLQHDKVNINSPEQWAIITDIINNQLSPIAGWKALEEQVKTIKEKASLEKDIDKELKELVLQRPDFVKGLLEAIDLKNVSEEDLPYYLHFIRIFSEKIVNAESRMKASILNIFEKLPSEAVKGIDELSELMKNWSLLQITTLTNILRNRLNAIDIFEKAIHNERTYEIKGDNSIHSIMEKSMWLIDENYWVAMSNSSMKNFIIDEYVKETKSEKRLRPDFACVTFENRLILVEIKRPLITLGKKELDQIEKYMIIADKYKGDGYRKIEGFLVGNKVSPEAKLIIKRRTGIEIWTYQDLLEKTRFKYKEFLDALEKSKEK